MTLFTVCRSASALKRNLCVIKEEKKPNCLEAASELTSILYHMKELFSLCVHCNAYRQAEAFDQIAFNRLTLIHLHDCISHCWH